MYEYEHTVRTPEYRPCIACADCVFGGSGLVILGLTKWRAICLTVSKIALLWGFIVCSMGSMVMGVLTS